jgi:hypothetical protein
MNACFEKTGPRWHVSQGRQLDIPVPIGQGISDNLFNLNEGLANFDTALTPETRAKSVLVGYLHEPAVVEVPVEPTEPPEPPDGEKDQRDKPGKG